MLSFHTLHSALLCHRGRLMRRSNALLLAALYQQGRAFFFCYCLCGLQRV